MRSRSSNCSGRNRTCENFEIDEDSEIFEFYYGFIKNIVQEMPAGWDGRRAIVESVLDRIFGAPSGRAEIVPGALRRRAIFGEE